MPSYFDNSIHQQHFTVDPSLLSREEATRRRSPGRKGRGKKSKKYDLKEDNTEKEGTSNGLPRDIISPSSILSQLRAASPPPPEATHDAPPSLLDAWNPPPSGRPSSSKEPTTEWAGNTPFERTAPQFRSNGASIAGSPPQSQPSPDDRKGAFLHASPPTSPRAAYRQPAHRNNEYQSFGDYLGSSPGSKRSPSAQARYSHYQPPPPHQPQAHYYSAPEIDFAQFKSRTIETMTGESLCCTFDSLSSLGHGRWRRSEDVLLLGTEYGLIVCHVDSRRVECIGSLEGLRGCVLSAKMIPAQGVGLSGSAGPLIALVIHGPFVPPSKLEIARVDDEEFDPSASELRALEDVQELKMTYYQTTVEIYSLQTGKQITTLLSSPKIEVIATPQNPRSSQTAPLGDFRIHANEKFITISSGISGEVYIFESIYNREAVGSVEFRCIGKIWTRTSPKHSKHSRSMSSPSTNTRPEGLLDSRALSSQSENAIIALSHRWLAFVPPPSSTQATLHGQVGGILSGHRSPGVTSHTSPAEPQVNCELDAPKDSSVMNKVARDLTQGAIKGAQWMATEGMHVWNNYWSRPSEQQRPPTMGSSPNYGIPSLATGQQFPPTHAQDNPADRTKNQPTIVAILDLEKLSQDQHLKPTVALLPMATFSLSLGCSLVSFSPSGLNLLTASAKGDDQHVWDLMRMIHGEAGRSGDPNPVSKGPSIRQVARFSRMTEAKIIDVVWTEPGGERLAIVTERGTVHVYDLPASASRWPPPGWRQRSVTPQGKVGTNDQAEDDKPRPESAGSTFSSALGMFAGKTQPLLAAVRGRSPSTSHGFTGFGSLAMTAGAGAKGSKAVAVGINRSVSAAAAGTVSTIRHLGENRLVLPTSTSIAAPGRVRWIDGKGQGRIAVTGGGVIRVYSIRQSSDPKAGHGRPAIVGNNPAEFSLSKSLAERSTHPGSFWRPQPSIPPRNAPDTHPLSFAEIDTCNSYQPFHSDRHVNLHVYNDDTDHHLGDAGPWIFGGPISATKINVGSNSRENSNIGSDETNPSHMEKTINIDRSIGEGGQVSVKTRNKRTKKSDGGLVTRADDNSCEDDDFQVLDYVDERV